MISRTDKLKLRARRRASSCAWASEPYSRPYESQPSPSSLTDDEDRASRHFPSPTPCGRSALRCEIATCALAMSGEARVTSLVPRGELLFIVPLAFVGIREKR